MFKKISACTKKLINSATEITVQDICDSTYSQTSYLLGACTNMGRHEYVPFVLSSELRISKCNAKS